MCPPMEDDKAASVYNYHGSRIHSDMYGKISAMEKKVEKKEYN